jgi:hypothetical protein
MKKLASRFTTHYPIVCAFIAFWAAWGLLVPYAVEQRGYVASLWQVVSGAISGLAVGSGLAWFVGGVGVAAMGTAFALPVLVVGAGLGAVLGAGFGSGFTLFRLISDPASYEVDRLKLVAVFAAALVLAGLAWCLGSLLRTKLSQAPSTRFDSRVRTDKPHSENLSGPHGQNG